ncbi:hypothetical protein QBC45DRAFT_340429 [Copromyces sp. CBS 386.78]|nr:hypothetical protein QBC45DRAFT_340429 [Copromyces sp. CBS 386.78]
MHLLFQTALSAFTDSQYGPIIRTVASAEWEELPIYAVAVRRGDLATPGAGSEDNVLNNMMLKETLHSRT